LDTKGIFTSPLLKRDTNNATIEDFAANHFDFGHNDLQPVAEALCPDVKKVRNWLESLGLQARMTGSGSAVFAQIKQADFPIAEQCSWTIKFARICRPSTERVGSRLKNKVCCNSSRPV
jgi:4-diphosphocytidyl-2-C-methyl-D-erythritol kinase